MCDSAQAVAIMMKQMWILPKRWECDTRKWKKDENIYHLTTRWTANNSAQILQREECS